MLFRYAGGGGGGGGGDDGGSGDNSKQELHWHQGSNEIIAWERRSDELSDKIWLGAIFLKDEGGYEIVLKSLRHYRRRLKTLGNSPELKDAAAMFASVLHQQAVKTVPKIDEVIKKIEASLEDTRLVDRLVDEIPFLEKALQCYVADICKAQDYGHEYFVKLVGDMEVATKDLETVSLALKRIRQFSE